MKKAILPVVMLILALAATADAATQFWDVNGATAGFGGANSTGTWNLTNTNWTSDGTGSTATVAWVQGSDASFGQPVGTVTVAAAIQANSIHLNNTTGVYTWALGSGG